MPKNPVSTSQNLTPIERVKMLREVIEHALVNQSVTKAEVELLLQNISYVAQSDQKHIVRGMQLTAEQIIPGLGLINYFSRLVEQKYPTMATRFTTELEANHVKLTIETTEQDALLVEELLEKYSLVLLGKLPLNQLVSGEKQLMELKQTLDLSVLTLNINQNLLHDIEDFTGKAPDLENLVKALHTTIGYGISSLKELQEVISELLSQEREIISESLQVLRERLYYNMSHSDEAAIKEALLTVKQHEPDAFEEIRQVINRASGSGAAGDTLYTWISTLSRVLPS
jgi:hypothetical protein